MQENFLQYTKLSIFGIALLLGITSINAWTSPSGTPPNNNVEAPINVGVTNQIKAGGLWTNVFGTTGGATFGGNVGIGTVAPAQKLDVQGNVYVNGNLGVGVASPVTKFEVAGEMRIGTSGLACGPTTGGSLRYAISKIQYCDGTTEPAGWKDLSGSAGCTYPAGQVVAYTSGSGNWSSVCSGTVRFELWGGGGGGGGGHWSAGGQGGGGSGGYYLSPAFAVTAGQNFAYSIGAGGSGGLTGAWGNAGGGTSFGPYTVGGGSGAQGNSYAGGVPGSGGNAGGDGGGTFGGAGGSAPTLGGGGAPGTCPYGNGSPGGAGAGGGAGCGYIDMGDYLDYASGAAGGSGRVRVIAQ